VLVFDADTRWISGSGAACSLQPGRLVLSRDEEGRLTDILIPDPEGSTPKSETSLLSPC
jgi:hypothetical protein